MGIENKVIIKGSVGRFSADMSQREYRGCDGRDHVSTLSISNEMPESGGGESSSTNPGTAAATGTDDDGGDADSDPDRRRPRSKSPYPPSLPPALLRFEPLSHYVGFGRSRIYQLISDPSIDPDLRFPAPIKVGKSSRWVRAEVDAWLLKQINARSHQVEG